jgi:hypothetical protein
MKDHHSNLPLLFAVALATALGIAAGLPMILRKNGMGLGVTSWFHCHELLFHDSHHGFSMDHFPFSLSLGT